jgi:hypothetical protein
MLNGFGTTLLSNWHIALLSEAPAYRLTIKERETWFEKAFDGLPAKIYL